LESLDTIEEGPESPDPGHGASSSWEGSREGKRDGPTSEVCFCGKVCTSGYRCAIDGFFMCTTCGKTLGKVITNAFIHLPVPH
jgi:hypothetical protein